MSTQEIISTNHLQKLSMNSERDQYTLWQTLGIWLAGGAPMWLLGWIAYPWMSADLPPMDAGLLRIKLLTIGLIWEFILVVIILYREEGNIRWSTICRRLKLNNPISSVTGQTRKALWWWVIPLSMLVAFVGMALRPMLVNFTGEVFPFLTKYINTFESKAMYSPELRAQWVGAWGWLGLIFVQNLFNSVLGEEFLFRGVLLPRMEGVFGKWDWVANGVIFGFYHLHQPWGIPASILTGLIYALSAKRFHTTWFSIILHSGQAVFTLFLILGLVLGLA
jgi:CAAX amino terminal protease family.